MEKVRLPKLPFGKKSRGSRKTRPLKAVQGMKAWAKAQSVMLYGVEHDEIWVHEGFNEVSAPPCIRNPASLSGSPLNQIAGTEFWHLGR